MTAKVYLQQAYKLDQRVNNKLQHIESLRSLTQKVTAAMKESVVSHTSCVTSLEDTIIRLMEAEGEMNQQIDALVNLKREIMQNLDRLGDCEYQLVLEKRYLFFQTWTEIAADLNIGLRWVHVIHTKALIALEEVLKMQKEAS